MNREQAFLLVLLVATAVASFYVLLPFLNFVLGALLLGVIMFLPDGAIPRIEAVVDEHWPRSGSASSTAEPAGEAKS